MIEKVNDKSLGGGKVSRNTSFQGETNGKRGEVGRGTGKRKKRGGDWDQRKI